MGSLLSGDSELPELNEVARSYFDSIDVSQVEDMISCERISAQEAEEAATNQADDNSDKSWELKRLLYRGFDRVNKILMGLGAAAFILSATTEAVANGNTDISEGSLLFGAAMIIVLAIRNDGPPESGTD